MNKIIQIAGRTISSNLNFKTGIYVLIVLISSLIFFKSSSSFLKYNLSDLRAIDAFYTSTFLSTGVLIMAGIPLFLYFSYLLANSISEEINSGIALLIFTRPVTRRDFLLGKALGYFLLFSLINAGLLFVFPAIANILLGVNKMFLFSMLKVSLALFFYITLFSFLLISLGVFLSANIRKSLISLSVLFGFILSSYVLFPLLTVLEKINFSIVKPFYAIIQFFNLKLFSATPLDFITGSYSSIKIGRMDIVIENFSSLIPMIFAVIVIPLGLIILSIVLFSRQDIT